MAENERRRRDALDAVGGATRRVRDAERDVELAVARALRWGATWAQISAELGVSPQAAHRRFRGVRYDPVSRRSWREPPPQR